MTIFINKLFEIDFETNVCKSLTFVSNCDNVYVFNLSTFVANQRPPLCIFTNLLQGRGFKGYPKGRNRDIKLVN